MFKVNSPAGLIGSFDTVDDAQFFAMCWMQEHEASTVITTGDRIVCALLCKKELRVKNPTPKPPSFWGRAVQTLSSLRALAKAKRQLERQRLRNSRLFNELERERNRTLALQSKLADLKNYQPPTHSQSGVDLPFTT
jgi:predicted RNase H-like nuclease (RuvC/YqgF family)